MKYTVEMKITMLKLFRKQMIMENSTFLDFLRKNLLKKPLSLVIAAAVFVCWGVGMFCLTSVTAEYAASRYLVNYSEFASILTDYSRLWQPSDIENDSGYKNQDAMHRWEAVDSGGRASMFHNLTANGLSSGKNGFLKRPDSSKVFSAAAVYDENGSLMDCSWSDFIYFEYLTKAQLINHEISGCYARTFFNRDCLTKEGEEIICSGDLAPHGAMRFTGSFDGVNFNAQKIEYFAKTPGFAADYDLPWNIIYEDPSAAVSEKDSVTFYSDYFLQVCCNPQSPGFSYAGRDYDNAAALAAKLGPELAEGKKPTPFYDGLDLLIPSVNYCYSYNGENYCDPYYPYEQLGDDPDLQLNGYIVSVVYCSPWRTAFGELRYLYLATFLLAAGLVFGAHSILKRYY